MMRHASPLLLLLLFTLVLLVAGCPESELEVGGFLVELDRDAGRFTATHQARGDTLRDVRVDSGTGTADVEMSFGSFRFSEETLDLAAPGGFGDIVEDGDERTVAVEDASGETLGWWTFRPEGDDTLVLEWTPADTGADRAVLRAACDADDHFLGLGSHAMDVDHVGQAFPVWVSEPGIGKVETEEYPEDWYFTGTRHATSFAMPWLLRPHQAHGLLVETPDRVEVDLCATDPDEFSVVTWSGPVQYRLISGDGPLQVVETLTATTGRVELPEPWVMGPYNDAIRGSERVREVAQALRDAGAPSTLIWSEDWKGAEQTIYGYHLSGEWFLDEEIYPDAVALADELEALGFQWYAYFSTFLFPDTVTWETIPDEAYAIRTVDGEPYWFKGATLGDTSLVDLTNPDAVAWFRGLMEDALAIGFDGWMADYAEWLPLDAALASGEDAWDVHNVYPILWQELNQEVVAGHDASFYTRSGWTGTGGISPVVWAGDQRTSFDTDDGFPTILPLGLGYSACGVPIYTHDVAGYQSSSNPPTDKELWWRWAALGAFSPILRTHHGASDDLNWQFDSDQETLAFWATMAQESMRLFPYRWGLARRAAERGTPMVLPTSFLFDGEEWGRMDAWMLGEALLVAPVLERGAGGREVALPAGTSWVDWWTHEPASSGWKDAALDEIPVFAAAGTTVPVFTDVPDTLVPGAGAEVTTLADVDGARTVYLFGGGGDFTEGDGTTYRPSGSPAGAGDTEQTLTSGTVEVAGVSLEIDGPVERSYRVVVVP